MNDRLAKAEALFHEALESSDVQRDGFLRKACGEDAELYREVTALLRASGVADRWLKETEGERIVEGPGAVIGRYKLLQQIGEGGCGVVYMAEQEEPVRRRVALKVIKLGMDTRQVVARFEAERQALAMMDHPNIAKVLDAGATDTGRPYFVMELVRGTRLTEFCDHKKLPPGARLELFIAVCHAVQHAHQKGIIHRDLKPSNILVTTIDGAPVPKVIDFGIAKATTGQRLTDKTLFTAFEQFIGTPAYMSPEQAEMSGVDIDTRTDVYSLGVVLYELLTGKTPFDTEQLLNSGIDEIRRTIRETEPLKPSTRLKASLHQPEIIHLLRRDLDWVVMKCLEKDRNRRYETVGALAADLQRHLKSEPIAARPPSAAYKFQKLVRRNKFAFLASSAIVTALILGAAVSVWQAFRATKAQRQAENDLWTARLAEARALRLSGELGRKGKALEALEQAARVRSSPELVNEAIAQLALFDLKPATNWTLPPGVRGHVAFDHAFERYVTHAQDGTVALWRLQDGLKLREWKVPYTWTAPIRFAPNDQYFVVPDDGDGPGMLIDASQPEPLRKLKDCVGFSVDSQQYASVEDQGAEVVIHEVTSGQPVFRLQPARGRKFRPAGAAHPTTNLLAVAEANGVSLWTWNSTQRVASFDYGGPVHAVALDGPWVAAAGTRNIRVWNRDNRIVREIAAHDGTISELWFFPRGELLVSHAWDGNSRIWHPAYGTLAVGTQGGFAQGVSPDGRRVGFVSYGTSGWWDSLAPQSRRELPPPFGASWCNFSRDGSLLVAWHTIWIVVYDVETGAPLPEPALSEANLAEIILADFQPDNRTLIVAGRTGIARWTLEPGTPLRWSKMTKLHAGPFAPVSPASLLANGTRVAVSGRDRNSFLLLPLSSSEPVVQFAGRRNPHSYALSPDNRWLATGTFHGDGPCIWNAQTGELVRDLETDNCHVWFSPDGSVLLIGGTEFYRFLETGTWRELHRIPTGSAQGVPNQAAWSADGRLLAIAQRRRQVRVLDGRTWEPIADLTSPHESTFADLQFSPDGRRLAVCRASLEVWDLAELSGALRSLGMVVDLRQGR